MNGLKGGTDFSFLLEKEVIQLRIGQNEIQIMLSSDVEISLECGFMISAPESGAIKVDGAVSKIFAGTALWRLIGRITVGAHVESLRQLLISFDDGSVLVLEDENINYESFTIRHPAGIVMV